MTAKDALYFLGRNCGRVECCKNCVLYSDGVFDLCNYVHSLLIKEKKNEIKTEEPK